MASTYHNNAEDYINKLYDHTQDRQKKMLTEAFKSGTEAIDTQKQEVQQQTGDYLRRTDVEAQKVAQGYKPADVSDSVNPQAALSMENQQKKNIAALRGQQENANAEFERMRKLYADQYSAAIKQAQAENDMERAQMLYEAAKAKDTELQAFYSQMGTPDNQAVIDKIYDSAIESEKQGLVMTLAEKLSGLEAQQEAQQEETDKNLTQAYVDALRSSKNYNEVQNAYGLGSGNMAAEQLARENALTERLTDLRKLQIAENAQIGQQEVAAGKSYADAVADIVKSNEQKRAEALYREALTQIPVAAASGSSGGSSGSGSYGVSEGDGSDPEYGYNDVRQVVINAKASGASNAEIQSIINAAYKDGEITDSQRMGLSYTYNRGSSAQSSSKKRGTAKGSVTGKTTVRDEYR